LIALCLAVSACSLPFGPSAGSQSADIAGYRVLRDVQLPGDTSRWDYLSHDSAAHRLYIAHLAASEVVAFDTEKQRVAGVVRDVAGVHGLVVAPELGRLYASATEDVIDTSNLRIVSSTPTRRYPDGLAFVPSLAKVYVSNEQDSVDTVLDATTGRRVASVPVGGSIGNSYYDPGSRLVYIASGSATTWWRWIQPPTASWVVTGWPAATAPTASRRTCRSSTESSSRAKATASCWSSTSEPRPLPSTAEVGQTPDVLTLDPIAHRLYVAAESGPLTIFDVGGARLQLVAQGTAGANAHSVAVDPMTHVVYLPLKDVGGRPLLRQLIAK